MGVIGVVKHDKPGIHGLIAAFAGDDRAGMTAQAVLGLDQCDMVGFCQHMGRAHAGNASPDNSNFLQGLWHGFEWHGLGAPS